MDVIDAIHETPKAWFVHIQVEGKPIKFKIDTGAAVTAIPDELGRKLNNSVCSIVTGN